MHTAIILAAFAGAPAAALAQPFHYAVNQAGSSMTFNISYSAPFQTTPAGSSYIVGTRAGPDAIPGNADDVVPPAAGSRTVPGLFGGDVNGNTIINLTSGSLSASGNNNSAPLRPTGAFDANFNVGLLTASVSNLNADLLGGGTATISANASIAYSSFREREPTCTIISLGPINVPVGNITATALTAMQNGPASGSLSPVPGQAGRFSFSIDVPALVTVTATFGGTAVPIDPQPVTLTLAGSVDMNQPTAPVTASVSINQSQTTPGPTPLDPFTFTEPLCSGTLAIKLTLGSSTTSIGVQASLTAAGSAAPCGPADIGRQGGLAGFDGRLDNNDFIAFISAFFAANPVADRGIQGGVAGQDGQFDNNDFIVFINQFFAGC